MKPREASSLPAASVLLAALAALGACAARPDHVGALSRCTYEGDCADARGRCAGGDAGACLTLGYLYGTATVEAREYHQPELGEAYLVRACKLSVLACSGVVFAAEEQRAACEDDYPNEAKLIQAACDEHYPPACTILADKLVDGVDVPRDTERAARLYAGVCDAEDRFPELVETDADGKRVPSQDPLSSQVAACVRAAVLAELKLAGDAPPARTTPARAIELDAARAGKYRKPARLPPARWLEEEQRFAQRFAQPAAERREAVLASRKLRAPVLIGCRDLGDVKNR